MKTFFKLLWRPWSLYADIGGRSRRSEFWPFIGLRWGVIGALYLLTPVDPATGEHFSESGSDWLLLVWLVWFFGTTIPAWTVTARRLHDANLSGKWVLTALIPYLGLLATPIIGLLSGTCGENDHGFDPRIAEFNAELDATFS